MTTEEMEQALNRAGFYVSPEREIKWPAFETHNVFRLDPYEWRVSYNAPRVIAVEQAYDRLKRGEL